LPTESVESLPELIPPSIPLNSDDENDGKPPVQTTKPIKSINQKTKPTTDLPIVAPPVELPLKRDERQAETIVLLPCLQFPESYRSPTEITVDFWRRYHTMRVSFSQKEIGYFSTADRADRTRCREDYRYLKKLIYPLEAKRVQFDLNIGAEYLDTKVSKYFFHNELSSYVIFLFRNQQHHLIQCYGGYFDIKMNYLLIISTI